jgi:hypothetical protein
VLDEWSGQRVNLTLRQTARDLLSNIRQRLKNKYQGLTPNQQRLYTLAMASEEYKGISAWARPEYGKGSASVGIVCKPNRMGSIVEVKRIEGRSFESKEEAE